MRFFVGSLGKSKLKEKHHIFVRRSDLCRILHPTTTTYTNHFSNVFVLLACCRPSQDVHYAAERLCELFMLGQYIWSLEALLNKFHIQTVDCRYESLDVPKVGVSLEACLTMSTRIRFFS